MNFIPERLSLINKLSFFKQHPFAVQTFFEQSLVISYAVRKEEIEHLIPECLELDLYDEKWAFITAAIVKSKNLRPKGFPVFMGNDFTLIGYRIFVKYTNNAGKRLRGLFILKSETDKLKMMFLGNLFTQYKYSKTVVDFTKKIIDAIPPANGSNNSVNESSHFADKSSQLVNEYNHLAYDLKSERDNGQMNHSLTVTSLMSDLQVKVHLNEQDNSLPAGSPFKDWKDARRFAGPLPFTFTYNNLTKEVLIIEGQRENWIPKPVKVIQSHFGFIEKMNFKEILLANAFIIEDVPYAWKKGKVEIWRG